MSTRLRVANLPHGVNEAILRMAFAQGRRTVLAIELPLDARTGRPKGYAYVDMGSEQDAQAAIRTLDGSDLDGKELRVRAERPEAGRRPPSGSGASGG